MDTNIDDHQPDSPVPIQPATLSQQSSDEWEEFIMAKFRVHEVVAYQVTKSSWFLDLAIITRKGGANPDRAVLVSSAALATVSKKWKAAVDSLKAISTGPFTVLETTLYHGSGMEILFALAHDGADPRIICLTDLASFALLCRDYGVDTSRFRKRIVLWVEECLKRYRIPGPFDPKGHVAWMTIAYIFGYHHVFDGVSLSIVTAGQLWGSNNESLIMTPKNNGIIPNGVEVITPVSLDRVCVGLYARILECRGYLVKRIVMPLYDTQTRLVARVDAANKKKKGKSKEIETALDKENMGMENTPSQSGADTSKSVKLCAENLDACVRAQMEELRAFFVALKLMPDPIAGDGLDFIPPADATRSVLSPLQLVGSEFDIKALKQTLRLVHVAGDKSDTSVANCALVRVMGRWNAGRHALVGDITVVAAESTRPMTEADMARMKEARQMLMAQPVE